MAATDRRDAEVADASSDAAAALETADLAHLVAVADGDCLAAAGLLALGCEARATPYHVHIVRTCDDLEARLETAADATTVGLGTGAGVDAALDPAGPVSPLAHAVGTTLGADPSPATALAGVVAAGEVPSQVTPDLLESGGLERRPGVAVPTDDLADGLAHSGLAHTAFSGDADAARSALADLGLAEADPAALEGADARRVASLLALAAGGAPDATSRAARAVERGLRPHVGGPLGSVEAFGDVLAALAEAAPGLAVGLALGEGVREPAVAAWREHGRAAHAGVRAAARARYDGVLVARTDGPVAAVARLLRDYRSPEPTVLVLGDGVAAAASVETPVGDALAAAAGATGGSTLARTTTGYARFDADRDETFVDAFRGDL